MKISGRLSSTLAIAQHKIAFFLQRLGIPLVPLVAVEMLARYNVPAGSGKIYKEGNVAGRH
jgi:hypothetical protein